MPRGERQLSYNRKLVNFLDGCGIGALLRPINLCIREQRRGLKRIPFLAVRQKRIREYMGRHSCRKVQLGTSDKILPSWLNTDIDPNSPDIVYLDCSKTFPFADQTLDFVYCEHFIEHLSHQSGRVCMSEVFRCLKKGGVFRIATPDLLRYLELFASPLTAAQEGFLEGYRGLFGFEKMSPCRALNLLMHTWGHQFIWTRDELAGELSAVGFSEIQHLPLGESRHGALQNIEQHQKFYGDEMNRFETMVVEATK